MTELNSMFVIYDKRPCLTGQQYAQYPAIRNFIDRFRSSFVYQAAWDAYFLKPGQMPEGLAEALRGEDDGL